MFHQNCNHPQSKRYQYKGFWIEIFIEADFEHNRILYTATVELLNQRTIKSSLFESREEAEFAAEELVDSWN